VSLLNEGGEDVAFEVLVVLRVLTVRADAPVRAGALRLQETRHSNVQRDRRPPTAEWCVCCVVYLNFITPARLYHLSFSQTPR